MSPDSTSRPRPTPSGPFGKSAIQGTITRIEPHGAFVDVGAPQEALLHISRIQKDPVNRIEDVLQPGQTVQVWVTRIDPASGRQEVSLIPPSGLDWKELKPGLRLTGKVVRIEKFGAFVEVGAERPGLVHVSEMGPGRRNEPSELVSLGEEVEVTVLDVDARKKQFRLSMKDSYRPEVEEPETPVPTAMEIALRRAMEGETSGAAAEKPGERSSQSQIPARPGPADPSGRKGGRSQQEDILSRTLQQKVRTTQPRED